MHAHSLTDDPAAAFSDLRDRRKLSIMPCFQSFRVVRASALIDSNVRAPAGGPAEECGPR